MSTGSVPDPAVPVKSSDHVLGPVDASVTLVGYGDFECPICKLAFPAMKLLLRRFSTDVRFIYQRRRTHLFRCTPGSAWARSDGAPAPGA